MPPYIYSIQQIQNNVETKRRGKDLGVEICLHPNERHKQGELWALWRQNPIQQHPPSSNVSTLSMRWADDVTRCRGFGCSDNGHFYNNIVPHCPMSVPSETNGQGRQSDAEALLVLALSPNEISFHVTSDWESTGTNPVTRW